MRRPPAGRRARPPAPGQPGFKQRAKEAGLPRICLRDLRHTHATLALQAGIHPKVVSERLGHSSISITLDIYSHAMPSLQKESAARVAALILGRVVREREPLGLAA